MIKIIFTRPPIKTRMGGVTNYLKNLIINIDTRRFNIIDREKYIKKTSRLKRTSAIEDFIIKITISLYSVIFAYRLITKNIDIVHSNPSLVFNAIIRESIFIAISSLFRKKIIVFMHGWNEDFAEKIERKRILKKYFVTVYNRSDAICVLSKDFKKKLIGWGIKRKIYVETTMVGNKLLKNYDFKKAFKKRQTEPYNILFLSRIEKKKGIYESIEAIKILRKRKINICMKVAGDGVHAKEIKKYLKRNNLKNIELLGFIENNKKRKTFETSYAYLFPTKYGEGMPISVLEAMAFGLPVITRYVGGIKDIFENGKNGFITNSTDPNVFADYLENIIKNKSLYKDISLNNYEYAQENLMAKKATNRIESIYNDLIKNEF